MNHSLVIQFLGVTTSCGTTSMRRHFQRGDRRRRYACKRKTLLMRNERPQAPVKDNFMKNEIVQGMYSLCVHRQNVRRVQYFVHGTTTWVVALAAMLVGTSNERKRAVNHQRTRGARTRRCPTMRILIRVISWSLK